ncbi:MAG: hypothetical protein AB1631_27975 [Acidobacteriota bacterium]
MKRQTLAFFFIALVFGANINLPAAAALQSAQDQSVDEKLTPDERREAISLARRFVKRLRETRDITPLIGEFFVSDFSPQKSNPFLEDLGADVIFEDISSDVIAELSREERVKWYALFFNFFHLATLQVGTMGREDEEESEEEKMKKILPSGLLDLLARNPYTARFSVVGNEEEQQDEAFQIESVEQMRSAISTMGEAVRLLQGHVTKNPPEQSPVFRKHIEEARKDFHYDPELYICEKPLDSFPAGARVINIETPPLSYPAKLSLIRSGGKLKIIFAMFDFRC